MNTELEYNFIVVDDDKYFSDKVEKLIKKEFKKSKFSIFKFDDYNNQFYNITDRLLKNKIYILDIEVPSSDGISIAREIRRKDNESTIIFISGYEKEYSRMIMKSTIAAFCLLYKFGSFEAEFTARLKELKQRVNIKKFINLDLNGTIYQFLEENIIFLESDDRKTIIHTNKTSVAVSTTLNDLELMLSENFIRTHKACVVNTDYILSYNLNKIVFTNNNSTDLITRKYKENLDKYFKKYKKK